MAKLNIDFAVNLGNSISGLQQFQAGLNSLAAQLKDFSSSLKAISSAKIDIKINTGEAANANQQLEASTEQTSAAIVDLKTRIAELNAQIVSSQNIIANTTSQEERIAAIKDLSAAQSELNRILAATPQQTLSTLNVNPQQLAAYSSALGASGVESKELSNRIAELQNRIKQLDVVIANTSSEQDRSNAIKLLTRDYAELAKLQKVQERVTPKAVQPKIVTDVFDKYIKEAQGATTVLQFLNKEQKAVEGQIKKLQAVASNTKSLEEYASAMKQIELESKKLQAINAANPINKTKEAANQANLVLVNTGRIAQDLPFGFLGIANNLNPLVESFQQLSQAAKTANTTIGAQLLASLKGFGGVGLAISAVSAALSFSSIGLSYWTRGADKAKDSLDPLKDILKATENAFKETTPRLQEVNVAFQLAKDGVISKEKALKIYNDTLGDTFGKFENLADAEASVIANTPAFISATQQKARAQVFYAKAAEAAAKGTTAELEDQTSFLDKINSFNKSLATTAFLDLPSLLFGATAENIASTAGKGFNIYADIQRKTQESAVSEVKKTTSALDAQFTKLGDEATASALKFEASYKKLGKFGTDKAGENAASNAKKIADLYKEINDDLAAIASRRDLNPLEKTEKSIGIIQSGFTKILDINPNEITNLKFVALEKQLTDLESKQIVLSADADVKNLENKLRRLREEARFFDKPTIDKQISDAEAAITALFTKYQDEKLKPIDAEDIKKKIDDVSAKLIKLRVIKISVDARETTKSLETGLKALKEEAIIFDKANIDDQIKFVEGKISTLYALFTNPLLKNFVSQASLAGQIANAQGILDTLNIEKLKLSIQKIDEDFNASIRNFNLKENILNQFFTAEKVSAAKKRLDDALALYNQAIETNKPADVIANLKIKVDKAFEDLQKLESQVTEQDIKVIARWRFVGDTKRAAEEELKLLNKQLNDEIVKVFPNYQKIVEIIAKIKVKGAEVEAEQAGAKAGEAFANGLNSAVLNLFADMASAAGELLVGGDFEKIIGGLLKNLGDAIKQFGTQMLLANNLITAAKKTFGEGPVGIIASLALIAAGAAISALAQQSLQEKKFAEGGYVSGAGTATSDSIPARLSNGEFVVKAKSVGKYGIGFLNAINNGTFKKFALGGLVSNMAIPKFSTPSVSINEPMGQQVPYIAATQVRGQDLRLILQRADSSYNRIV